MKFPNGPRTLTYQPGVAWKVVVDDTGMDTPVGRFPYVDPPGQYRKDDDFVVRRLSDTEYAAVYLGMNFVGTWS